MLVEIQCDKFAKEHQVIPFKAGLNTVLGSAGGSNAIGKSTFLWIVDYAFGGKGYYSMSSDIKKEIGTHTIYFTFQFGEEFHYFYRSTDDSQNVCRCDKDRHLIVKMPLDDYRAFLYQEYQINLPGLFFSDITERFFRIYGRENAQEKYPLLLRPRESDEKAVDFLLKLFGHCKIVNVIKNMEDELGIKAYQLKSRQHQLVDIEKIEMNEKTIESLKKRLQKLMENGEEAQMSVFGFDTNTFEKVTSVQKELNGFVRKRNRLQSQLNSIQDNIADGDAESSGEFESLVRFFPDADLKAFAEIDHFHKKIREILSEEMAQEINRLQPIIGQCDREINRLRQKIEESGLAKQMSERVLSQCVSISKSIDKLQEENDGLIHQKELQAARTMAERRLENLLQQQTEHIDEVREDINLQMAHINAEVAKEQETAPVLQLSPQKDIVFGTPGNTSEGTAFKSLVIYDLCLLELCPVPALIHDSNILKRIEDTHLEHILECYQNSGRQIFIAFDKADSATVAAQKMLESTAVLHLSDGNELFGHSWSKREANE